MYWWGVRGDIAEDEGAEMRIDAISLYAKYTETYHRLRPPNTFRTALFWNDLQPWLQAVWVELAIYVTVHTEECKS
jgi:hypothetical protein